MHGLWMEIWRYSVQMYEGIYGQHEGGGVKMTFWLLILMLWNTKANEVKYINGSKDLERMQVHAYFDDRIYANGGPGGAGMADTDRPFGTSQDSIDGAGANPPVVFTWGKSHDRKHARY